MRQGPPQSSHLRRQVSSTRHLTILNHYTFNLELFYTMLYNDSTSFSDSKAYLIMCTVSGSLMDVQEDAEVTVLHSAA